MVEWLFVVGVGGAIAYVSLSNCTCARGVCCCFEDGADATDEPDVVRVELAHGLGAAAAAGAAAWSGKGSEGAGSVVGKEPKAVSYQSATAPYQAGSYQDETFQPSNEKQPLIDTLSGQKRSLSSTPSPTPTPPLTTLDASGVHLSIDQIYPQEDTNKVKSYGAI